MNDDARDALATVAALQAARETGVLDALLDDADTPSDVAAQTAVDERAASVLVDVLADRGFFEVVDGTYEPTNRALGLLTKTDLRSIGRVPHETTRFARLAALGDSLDATRTTDGDSESPLDTGEDGEGGEDSDDLTRDALRDRLGYAQATPDTAVNATVSAIERAAPHATSVLDIGGAPGRHATEFAARGKHVTLRDTPHRVEAARPLLAPRVVTLDPGTLTTDLPATDLVYAIDLTPRLDDTDLASALANARDALARDRTDEEHTPTLVLVEHVRDHSPRTPTRRLEALANDQPGDHRTLDALHDHLADADFTNDAVHAIPGLDQHAITATPTIE